MVRALSIATSIVLSFLATHALASPAPVGDSIATIVPEGAQKKCIMTSKPGQDCNVNTCRAGGDGGYCYVDKGGRCRIKHNDVFECKVKCRCIAG